MEVSDVVKMRVCGHGMQFQKRFRKQNSAVCLGDQASEVQVSIWLFPGRALQVDEIRDAGVRESAIRGSVR